MRRPSARSGTSMAYVHPIISRLPTRHPRSFGNALTLHLASKDYKKGDPFILDFANHHSTRFSGHIEPDRSLSRRTRRKADAAFSDDDNGRQQANRSSLEISKAKTVGWGRRSEN